MEYVEGVVVVVGGVVFCLDDYGCVFLFGVWWYGCMG